jgi:hypothetical protein
MEAFRRLFQNHDLYNSIMTQMGDMMYANFRAQDEAVFNPERFKEKVLPVMQAEFTEIQAEIRSYPFVADWLVKVIAAETAPSMDGANDVLQNAFNRLYCSPRKVAFMDKKSHFRSLVSYFEVFLKKIYFIENDKEMVVTRENARPGEMPTLADCIYQTPCLKRLKYEPESNKFKTWLQQLRDWRNEQSHQAPIANEAEYDAAIHIVTALYLYVTAYNIKWLQSKMQAQLISMNTETEAMPMAAERPVESEPVKSKSGNMKVLSVQQPWASAICTGVKDIENRTWQPKSAPGRILIHASAKKVPKDFDEMNLDPEMISTMANLKLFGIMPEYEDMPLSAIIGYVDVTGFDSEKNDSPWAGANSTHWHLENAYLFDEPIKDVKGKLGLFDYPLDEGSLPPAHKVALNFPVLDGDCLTVHVGDRAWKILQEDDSTFCIDINDPYTIGIICKDDSFELKPVKELRIIHANKETKQNDVMVRKVTNCGWDTFRDENGNDAKYRNEEDGAEIPWMYAIYELERKD